MIGGEFHMVAKHGIRMWAEQYTEISLSSRRRWRTFVLHSLAGWEGGYVKRGYCLVDVVAEGV